jgi:HEAT repeat protein
MLSLELAIFLALVAQPQAEVLAEQQEFAETLATEEGYDHVFQFVRQNKFLPFGFAELAASATQSDLEHVPFRALAILKELGPDAAAHDEVVYPFLSHEDRNLRLVAVNCLGAMHPGRFFPEIARMAVFDEDGFVHGAAVKVLTKSESPEAVPYILAIYLDEVPQRAAAGIRWTGACSPELQEALIPGLIQVLRRPESAYVSLSTDMNVPHPLREDAIDTLGEMGELAAPYLEVKQMQQLEEDPAIKIRYAVAIINIGGVDEKQVGLVRDIMEGADIYLCGLACEACIDSPLLAAALQPSLVALADHKEPFVRNRVAWTLWHTEISSPEIIAALQTLSTDYADEHPSRTCWSALNALAARGELQDPLEQVLEAMQVVEFGENDGWWVLFEALGEEAAVAAIELDFATADEGRRLFLMDLLAWGVSPHSAGAYERLLELTLTSDERERLESGLERVLERNAPLSPIEDWRLPATAKQ